MNFLLILLFNAGIVIFVYSNAIHARDSGGNLCPPPESIEPCTCFIASITGRVTARCTNFTNYYDIKAIFDQNPDWNIQDICIEECVLPFLPAKMLEEANFQSLNVSSTSLITLFDTIPVTTPEVNLYLYDVKISRGFQWNDIADSNLLEMGIFNMIITSLGKDFKDNIPSGVQRLWFENNGITSINYEAFSQLKKLELLVLRNGSLKKLSRDWFPRPWNVSYLDFSYQRITTLPEDFFTDLPELSFFLFEGNLLSTISEKIFTKHNAFYGFGGNPVTCNCEIKWIVGKLIQEFMQGECAEPDFLKGKELNSLTEYHFRHCH